MKGKNSEQSFVLESAMCETAKYKNRWTHSTSPNNIDLDSTTLSIAAALISQDNNETALRFCPHCQNPQSHRSPRLPVPPSNLSRHFHHCFLSSLNISSSLIPASKFTQDKCYSNQAWAKLFSLPPHEIGCCERVLSNALKWRL
jgi:hypothetical protein